MKSQSRKALMLLMILSVVSILLCSCKTTVQQSEELVIPQLNISVERPFLDSIPELDTEGWTDRQIEDVSNVLSVYNMNMGKLAIYSQTLEKTIELQKDYLNEVIAILNK